MSNKNNYTAELKYHIVMEYIRGYVSVTDLCKAYEIAVSTFHDWKRRYEKYGLQGLEESKTFKEYSKELKESAVLDYLSGDYSLANVADKYELSGKTVLRNWIKRYNSHKELNTTGAKGDEVMTKRKNTSLKERIEIVKYCIQENKDYHKTSKVYEVSYQQVYQWVKKYERSGEDGLEDRRGKMKIELNKDDEAKVEMKKLIKDNERLKMENDFLKKLGELERRGILNPYINNFKYEAIQVLNNEKKYSIISLCEIVGVSRAAYYKWLKRVNTENDTINDNLIKEIIKLYEEFNGIYGYRRMTMNINRKLCK